jgi:hypothetical protein
MKSQWSTYELNYNYTWMKKMPDAIAKQMSDQMIDLKDDENTKTK